MFFQRKTNLLDHVLFSSSWRNVGGYKYNFGFAQNAYKLLLVKHVSFFLMGQQYKKYKQFVGVTACFIRAGNTNESAFMSAFVLDAGEKTVYKRQHVPLRTL